MHFTGIPSCVGLGDRSEDHSGLHRPSLVVGTAILASREAWLDVGGFDDRFFLYMEDADLSLRAVLQRYEVICAGDAVVTHRYNLNMRPEKFYWLERNRLLTVFKAYEARTLRRMAGALALTELATCAYAVMRGPEYFSAWWRGHSWVWRHRQECREARARVQSVRQVPDSVLLASMSNELPFEQLVRQRWLAAILRFVITPLHEHASPAVSGLAAHEQLDTAVSGANSVSEVATS